MSGGRSARPTVAFVTCAEYPDGYFDDLPAVEPLADLGVDVSFAMWDDPAVNWAGFDLVVLRSTWDYPQRLDEFLAWAATVPNLRNSIDAVRWSSDKRYLADLAGAGAPIIPTYFVRPEDPPQDVDAAVRATAATANAFVVKPSVGAGSVDAGRFDSADSLSLEQAIKHTTALIDSGRTAMVQPYLDGIDVAGEAALTFLNGEFSHAIRKEPTLAGGLAEFEGLFIEERTSPLEPSAAQLTAADAVLDAMPFERHSLLYTRVDLLPGADGSPLLLELELVEPSLFLADVPGAGERFATAVAAVVAGNVLDSRP